LRQKLPIVLVFAAASLLPIYASAQAKIGYVMLDRILREAPAAQRAQKKLEQEFAPREQELAGTGAQLKKMQENLEKNGVTMSESERQKSEREFSDLNREFQRKQREYREDLNQRKNEALQGVLERAYRAVRQIAETEKLDIVFQNDQAVWASPRIDITDKVIKALAEPGATK